MVECNLLRGAGNHPKGGFICITYSNVVFITYSPSFKINAWMNMEDFEDINNWSKMLKKICDFVKICDCIQTEEVTVLVQQSGLVH